MKVGVEMVPSVTRDVNFQELLNLMQIDNIKLAMEFICRLESATLDDKEMGLDLEVLEYLQHPPQHQIEALSFNVCPEIDLYLAIKNASQNTYLVEWAIAAHGMYNDIKKLVFPQGCPI